jgi:PPP family 3-phenylpropionic acid transporter
MTSVPIPPSSLPGRLRLRVSGLYGSLYLHYGMLAFLPLWLTSRGVPATQIGALMAIPLFLRLIAVAPVVAWSGRRARLRDALTVFALLAAVTAAATGLIHDHLHLLIVFVLFSLAWDQLPVLADAYAVVAVRAGGLDFGRLRVWGSLGVIAGAGLGGGIFQIGGIGLLPWMAGALLVLLAVVSRLVPTDHKLMPPEEQRAAGDWKAVFKDRQMILAMVATSLVAGSHGIFTAFAAIQWAGQGWSPVIIGALTAVGIGSEIVILWFGQKWLNGADPRVLILCGVVAAIVRWVGMALSPALPFAFALQTFGALTTMAPVLGLMLVIARRAPAHLVGVAQGVSSVILGLGLALVVLVSGFLWARGIPVAYLTMAVMCALAIPFVLGREREATPSTPTNEDSAQVVHHE